MAEFIPGLELAALYYDEAVKPILSAHYPRLLHSAGLIGHPFAQRAPVLYDVNLNITPRHACVATNLKSKWTD